MAKKYSSDLYQYIGIVELTAFQSRDSFARYDIFHRALELLSRENFPKEELQLARSFLENRIRETKPCNIGIASGEAGEAD